MGFFSRFLPTVAWLLSHKRQSNQSYRIDLAFVMRVPRFAPLSKNGGATNFPLIFLHSIMIFGELLILPSGFWHKEAFSISYRSLNFCSSESLEIQNGLQEVKRFGGGGCFGLEVNLASTVGENI